MNTIHRSKKRPKIRLSSRTLLLGVLLCTTLLFSLLLRKVGDSVLRANGRLHVVIKGSDIRDTNAQSTTRCVPWDVNEDEWWFHHPEWEAGVENDTHYCFERIRDPQKAKFLRNLYNIQNGKNRPQGDDYCSNVTVKHMMNSGWGADMLNVADALEYAARRGRPVQIDQSIHWHYAMPKRNVGKNTEIKAACPQKNMYCYFLNMTPCTSYGHKTANKTFFHNVELLAREQRFRWYIDFIVRPQAWLRKRVYHFLLEKGPQMKTPCTVMHVRRNDVVLHGVQARKFHPIEEYLNATATVRPNILLLTDDHNAIGEAKVNFPQYNWMYIDRPRFHAVGGWEHQTPSDDPIFEVVVLFAIFRLVRYCDQIILSHGRFSDYLYEEMKRNKQPDSIDHVNIDKGKDFLKDVANSQNQWTYFISKDFGQNPNEHRGITVSHNR